MRPPKYSVGITVSLSRRLGSQWSGSGGFDRVRWLRLPHGGKSAALNAGLMRTDADVILTVDADTVADRGAIEAVRQAFSREPQLVAVTGVITPRCPPTALGRAMQWFQTYEYIRNFLGRYAWMRVDCLQLISGAFAGFRRDAVTGVGGFDDACLVEDYELVARMRRFAGDQRLDWRFRVLGDAQARTEAPASVRRSCGSAAAGSAVSCRPTGGIAAWSAIPGSAGWAPSCCR